MSLIQAATSGVKWTALSSIISTVSQLLRLVVLAWLLSPEDFGLMAIVLVVIGFGRAFADMGVSQAIIHRQDVTRNQLSSLYWLTILSGLIAFLLIWLSTPDRDVVTATVDGATLQDIISIASLDASTPIRPLRSFFVYASDLKPRENELYILVTSTEVARFDEGLLGTAEIEFEGVPGITVKSLLRTALAEQAREDTTAVFVNTERALRSKIPPAPFARGIPIKVGDISFVILGYER